MPYFSLALIIAITSVLLIACCTGCGASPAPPARIILDTDMGNDIDDALALAMLHALASRGQAELLAVTVCKDNPYAAVYVDLVNRFYGRPDVPVGAVRNGVTPEDYNYIRQISELKERGRYVFSRKLASGKDAPEAVSLLRKTLANQPDGSVTLVSIGFFTNVARLLESKPDSYSPLAGIDLVRAKIRLYCCMAGDFSPAHGPEYNAKLDPEATRKVLEGWPTPLVASGFEIGLRVMYPASSIERDFGWAKRHPVAEAYRAFDKMPFDRPSWDLTAVLYAVCPDGGYFGLSEAGRITLEDDFRTPFSPQTGGGHRYLTMSDVQAARVLEACIWLASSPVTHR